MQNMRSLTGYMVVPMAGEIVAHGESQSPVKVWEPLHTIARSPAAASNHFAGTSSNQSLLAEEFSSYIRQAYDYFEGGSRVQGVSAALLYYYSALQLAKAELLKVNPTSIVGVRIGHGLSHQITNASDPASDFLTVQNGVFPQLYEKRTGTPIPLGTTLNIADLIRYVPEIATELQHVLGVNSSSFPLYYAMGTNNADMWPLMLAEIPGSYPSAYVTEFEFAVAQEFEEVTLDRKWKTIFAISERALMIPEPRLFQGRKTHPQGTTVDEGLWKPVATFKRFLDSPIEDRAEAYFWPTCSNLPMTPAVARYAIMYYLSSLVRYKPSILSHNRFPDYAWLLESFVSLAPINLITSANDGIRGKWNIYNYRLRS